MTIYITSKKPVSDRWAVLVDIPFLFPSPWLHSPSRWPLAACLAFIMMDIPTILLKSPPWVGVGGGGGAGGGHPPAYCCSTRQNSTRTSSTQIGNTWGKRFFSWGNIHVSEHVSERFLLILVRVRACVGVHRCACVYMWGDAAFEFALLPTTQIT